MRLQNSVCKLLSAKNDFNLNIKPENVINKATITSLKTEPEEKEEIEKNNEKLNQNIEKCNQRKKNLLKIDNPRKMVKLK